MALSAARAHGTVASAPMAQEMRLLDELSHLQRDILDGKHAQFQLPDSALLQLKASLANLQQTAVENNVSGYRHNAGMQPHSQSLSKPSSAHVPRSAQNPPYAASIDGVGGKPPPKRQRIENELRDQTERRRAAYARERDAYSGDIDVDQVYHQAQSIVTPVSGLKPVFVPSRKSSFDENDYYSSQIESAWSPDAKEKALTVSQSQAFTADYERLPQSPAPDAAHKRQKLSNLSFNQPSATSDAPHRSLALPIDDDADDEYVPVDPNLNLTSLAGMESEPTTQDQEDSEYEPGAVMQQSPTATFATANSPPIPIVRNQLTHIAAPQANRVSPLATQKRPGYELQLINGRPEVVKIPRARHVSSQTRPSSASSLENGNVKLSKRKGKKRKRDVEHGQKIKKRRDRQLGLDMSNQIPPQPFVKDEPYSPAVPQTLWHQQDRVRPVQPAYAMESALVPGYYETSSLIDQRVEPARAASTVLRAPPQSIPSDVRRYASLQHAHGLTLEQQPRPSTGQLVPRADIQGVYGSTQYSQPQLPPTGYRIDELPDARLSMAPPPAPIRPAKRIVVDQFGNRYVEAGPVPSTERPSQPVEDSSSRSFARAPSRISMSHTSSSAAEQYDPANARFDIPQTSNQRAQAPSYPMEYNIDGRRYRVREYVDNTANMAPAPSSPEFQPVRQVSQVSSFQPPPYPRLESASFQENGPQFIPASLPAYQTQIHNQQYSVGRPYSVHPEQQQQRYHHQQQQQQQPLTYAPRQGSVAPVQYVQHESAAPVRAVSVMGSSGLAIPYGSDPRSASRAAGNHVQYVDAREYDAQAAYMRPVEDFRQY